MEKQLLKRIILIIVVVALTTPMNVFGEEKANKKEEDKEETSIPNHVIPISKENTYPNSSEDQEVVEPSEMTEELLADIKVPIENPDLIKQLNESTIKPSPIGIGYRGMVFLGRWPLHYESEESTVNWEYQKINVNELNNIGGDTSQVIKYNKEEEKKKKRTNTNKKKKTYKEKKKKGGKKKKKIKK